VTTPNVISPDEANPFVLEPGDEAAEAALSAYIVRAQHLGYSAEKIEAAKLAVRQFHIYRLYHRRESEAIHAE
jgi:hypothetical protein